MMDADAAMDLVVYADLAVRLVLAAGKLNAVHAEVGVSPARPASILSIDLRQGDESAGVFRPADKRRQPIDGRFMFQHRSRGDELRSKVPESARHVAIAPGIFPERLRIDLELDQMSDGLKGVPEEKARALERAE